jgi:hypothetical protein
MNTVQQIQTNMIVPPGTAELTEQITVHHNQFTFLSKIPFVSCIKIYYFHFIFIYYRFFQKSEKPKKSEAHRLKLFEIYRFADKFDVFLMIIGMIAG